MSIANSELKAGPFSVTDAQGQAKTNVVERGWTVCASWVHEYQKMLHLILLLEFNHCNAQSRLIAPIGGLYHCCGIHV